MNQSIGVAFDDTQFSFQFCYRCHSMKSNQNGDLHCLEMRQFCFLTTGRQYETNLVLQRRMWILTTIFSTMKPATLNDVLWHL